MKRILLPAIWLATIAAAFFIGNKTSTSSEADTDAKEGKTARNARHSSATSGNRTGRTASRDSRSSANSSVVRNRDITSIAKNHDPLARVSDLLAMISKLSPDEFESVVADFRASGMVRDRMSEYAMLLHAWAQADPHAALAYAEKNTSTQFARQTILTSWAAKDPEGALAWANEKHEGEGANPWLVGIIRGIATKDPSRATEIMSSMPFSRERGEALSALLPHFATQGADAAQSWLITIKDEKLRNGATARLAGRLANENPKETAAWIATISDDSTRARATSEVADAWAGKDLNAAVQWTDSLSGSEKMAAASQVISTYARKDAEKAATWLNSLSGQDGYERVQHSFIWSTARQNPAISLSQVGSLSDEKTRNRYYDHILRSWHQNDAQAAGQWMNSNSIPDSVRERVVRPRNERGNDRRRGR